MHWCNVQLICQYSGDITWHYPLSMSSRNISGTLVFGERSTYQSTYQLWTFRRSKSKVIHTYFVHLIRKVVPLIHCRHELLNQLVGVLLLHCFRIEVLNNLVAKWQDSCSSLRCRHCCKMICSLSRLLGLFGNNIYIFCSKFGLHHRLDSYSISKDTFPHLSFLDLSSNEQLPKYWLWSITVLLLYLTFFRTITVVNCSQYISLSRLYSNLIMSDSSWLPILNACN